MHKNTKGITTKSKFKLTIQDIKQRQVPEPSLAVFPPEILLESEWIGHEESHHPPHAVFQRSPTNVCNHGNLSMTKVTGRKFCIK